MCLILRQSDSEPGEPEKGAVPSGVLGFDPRRILWLRKGNLIEIFRKAFLMSFIFQSDMIH